jgi:hypothetical protein
MTIISTDTNRIETFISYCHIIWTAPLQLLIIVAFLISQIGWPAIVAVSLIIALIPVQGVLFKQLAMARK